MIEKEEKNEVLQIKLDVYLNVARKDAGVQTEKALAEQQSKMFDLSVKSASGANVSVL